MGRAWVYGDNVDTDVIIPARYLTTTDPAELGAHALEDLDKSFTDGVKEGDVVFGGANFGCGSSREHAPVALRSTGIAGVVALSFARIFFRNAINTGLPIFVCSGAVSATRSGDLVQVDVSSGAIRNATQKLEWRADPLPEFVLDIVHAGGLVEWVRQRRATA